MKKRCWLLSSERLARESCQLILLDLPCPHGQQATSSADVGEGCKKLGTKVASRGALSDFEGYGFGKGGGKAVNQPAQRETRWQVLKANNLGRNNRDSLQTGVSYESRFEFLVLAYRPVRSKG